MKLVRITNRAEAASLGVIGREAFPPEEYVPPENFTGGETAVFSIEDGGTVGYMCAAFYERLTYLFYFAVVPQRRGRGTGSAALSEFLSLRSSVPVVIDPELAESGAANFSERVRRRAFYLARGFRPTGKGMSYNGVSYELLCTGAFDADYYKSCIGRYGSAGFVPEFFDVTETKNGGAERAV